jgi:agmatinase
MYNALNEVPGLKKLVQVGIRDYSQGEAEFIEQTRTVVTYFDRDIRVRQYEGETFRQITDEIISRHLPDKVYISFDIDGLDPKLCPNTGTPVQGGFETEQVFYLFDKLRQIGQTDHWLRPVRGKLERKRLGCQCRRAHFV